MKALSLYFLFIILISTTLNSQNENKIGEIDSTNSNCPPLNLAPIADGPFEANWESLKSYETPEWFRDVKFGIWAHWGPQSEPEVADWYARGMYEPNKKYMPYDSSMYLPHIDRYGHPSEFGFKDVINLWKAAKFDPDQLLGFYKECGAKYFMALANHHENFDNYDSKFQPWNSVNMGPKKDLIGMWSAAARKHDLRFGVSVHASHAWTWYEPAQGADSSGPYAGVPYDGNMTKEDGKGLWWEGYDPQDLYAQNHELSIVKKKIYEIWEWNVPNCNIPDAAYLDKFYNRTKQLWDDYNPDLIYFDDHVLPFHGLTDEIGLNLAAHFYNSSIKLNGSNEAVMNTKKLNEEQRKALGYDIERGKATDILPFVWQTDTCLGNWHYSPCHFINKTYKSSTQVIHMLADIVSKNGNLMLSVPLQRDGTPDSEEIRIMKEIGVWLKVNGEAIYSTRPWKTFGEGPAPVKKKIGNSFNDREKTFFTAKNIRFTQSKDGQVVYAICLGTPENTVRISALGANAKYTQQTIKSVQLIGSSEKISWKQQDDALVINLSKKIAETQATSFKITFNK
ncbi:alpha-L-fucosidase [Aureibaculum algae]|uniref:alpha-L-fucosidase n=1 Tax=Aureibaculum algae TaxID=2584122 RepID=A0A5B7TLS3_9FLAO|nr:alpha-L-fucosidase [Aureibaculum algae]QCX37325.1 alpha-L-fucosidase [Aureibaculum algae]